MNQPSMSTEEVLTSIRDILNGDGQTQSFAEEKVEDTKSTIKTFELTKDMIIFSPQSAKEVISRNIDKHENLKNINSEEVARNIIATFSRMFREGKPFTISPSVDISTSNIQNDLQDIIKKEFDMWLQKDLSEILEKSISQEFERVMAKDE